MYSKAGGGPDMAAINSLGGPHVLPQTVQGDHMFCHGQSGGGGGGGPVEV